MSSSDGIIDWHVLGQICHQDEELLRHLLDVFAQEMEKDLAALQTALDAAEMEASGRVAHRIHGAAMTVGAGTLVQLSSALERSRLCGDRASAASVSSRLRDHTAILIAVMNARRARTSIAPAGLTDVRSRAEPPASTGGSRSQNANG